MPNLTHWLNVSSWTTWIKISSKVGIEISKCFTWKMSNTSRMKVVLPTPLGPGNPNNLPPIDLEGDLITCKYRPEFLAYLLETNY
jgi:hypothetical protein